MQRWSVILTYAIGVGIGYLVRDNDPVIGAMVAIVPAISIAVIVWAFTPQTRGRRPYSPPPYITRP